MCIRDRSPPQQSESQHVAKSDRKYQPREFRLGYSLGGVQAIRSGHLSEQLKCPKTIEICSFLFLKLASSMVWLCWTHFWTDMSYNECQPQNLCINWIDNQIRMVPANFLGCKCFIQSRFLCHHSIDHQFNNKLEQQASSPRKLHMHIIHNYFN